MAFPGSSHLALPRRVGLLVYFARPEFRNSSDLRLVRVELSLKLCKFFLFSPYIYVKALEVELSGIIRWMSYP